MLTYERKEKLLAFLADRGTASINQLTALLSASEATVRRDLTELAAAGRIRKVRGGAALPSHEFLNREDPVLVKMENHRDEKTRIARYAAGLIFDDDYVFIDAGSTTFLLASFIENSRATFVTNGISHAHELAKKGCRVMILGGDLKDTTEAVIGAVAAANLQRYNFSKAFLGANGIALKQGLTTTDTDEATIKAIAMEKSFVSYVLTDASKFGKVAAVKFAPVNRACIICDRCDDEEIKQNTVVKEVTE